MRDRNARNVLVRISELVVPDEDGGMLLFTVATDERGLVRELSMEVRDE